MAEIKNPAPLALAGTAASGLFGIASTIINNRAQKRLAMDMYNMQRKDALDNWNRENMYNSPAAQMQRLKEAGLNPNLVYGNGATATGGSISSVRADVPTLQQAPTPNFQGGILGYMQVKQMQTQMDATEEAIKMSRINQALNLQRTLNESLEYDRTQFTLSQQKRLADTVAEIKQKELENLQGAAAIKWNQNEYMQKTMQFRVDAAKGEVEKIAEQINLMGAQQAKIGDERKEIEQRILRLKNGNYFDSMTMNDRINLSRDIAKVAEKRVAGQEFENELKNLEISLGKYKLATQAARDLVEAIRALKPRK